MAPEPTPPAPKPATDTGAAAFPPVFLKFAALQIAPTTAEEARAATSWARSRGFAALFVPVSLWDDRTASRLQTVIAEAKRSGVAVYPVVSLLGVGKEDAEVCTALARTRNLVGETLPQYAKRRIDTPALRADEYEKRQIAPLLMKDWLDAFDAGAQKTVAEKLATVATVPGIGGIVLTDVAAPGMQSASSSWTNGATGARTGGYNAANRVAFIRQENIDPIDLPPYGNLQPNLDWSVLNNGIREEPSLFASGWRIRETMNATPAYRRDATGAWKAEPPKPNNSYNFSAWNALLTERNRAAISAVRQAAHLPDALPVWVMIASEDYGTPRPRLWPLQEPLPPVEPGKEALYPFTIYRTNTAVGVRSNAAQIAQWASKEKNNSV